MAVKKKTLANFNKSSVETCPDLNNPKQPIKTSARGMVAVRQVVQKKLAVAKLATAKRFN